ncbi:uncharacterized protein BDZ99DRAFT_481377 [Mytilinidion resinicola]|uniref:Uncharacterized protein n=1 Tax=Mytilinidion resinicola TaxID=574789 RepID=A0A6A6Y5U5_9PEZI|nr:uncharacterized protein BDZ99DRAFT_481377 [Mytilinidion resinicola]KAF2804211.1 hypothetical protein BDZ99DRAFT_481377 [Mytilinidion resinicola]
MPSQTPRHGSRKDDRNRPPRQYPIEEIIDGVEDMFKNGRCRERSHREHHDNRGEFRPTSHPPRSHQDPRTKRSQQRPASHQSKDQRKDFLGQPKIISDDGTTDYPNMHTWISLRESCNSLISGYDTLEFRYENLSEATQCALLRTPNPIERFTIRCVLHPAPFPHVLKIREMYLAELRMANAALKSIARNEDGKTPTNKERLATIFTEVADHLRVADRSLTDVTGVIDELKRQDKIQRDMDAGNWMGDEQKKWRADQRKALWHEIYDELEKEVPLKEAVLGTVKKWEGKTD